MIQGTEPVESNVRVQFAGSVEVTAVEDASVIHDGSDVCYVSIPDACSASSDVTEGIKFWIDDVPSFDARLMRSDWVNGQVFATFVVLLKKK
jgi:hypothetical protein